jgi:predicted Zn-dependent protease
VFPQEERQIGRKEAEELERTVGLVLERRIVEYVEAIGARLARAAERSDVAWQWSVADELDANAFASRRLRLRRVVARPPRPSASRSRRRSCCGRIR